MSIGSHGATRAAVLIFSSKATSLDLERSQALHADKVYNGPSGWVGEIVLQSG